jgi:hypothetical protein
LKVSIWNDENKLIGQVTVGKMLAESSLYFAKVKGRLFQINKRFLDEMPSELAKFKNK